MWDLLFPLSESFFPACGRFLQGFPSLSPAHVLGSNEISSLAVNLPTSCPQISTSASAAPPGPEEEEDEGGCQPQPPKEQRLEPDGGNERKEAQRTTRLISGLRYSCSGGEGRHPSGSGTAAGPSPPSLALPAVPTGPPLKLRKQNARKKKNVSSPPRSAGYCRQIQEILDIGFREKLKKPILQTRRCLVK